MLDVKNVEEVYEIIKENFTKLNIENETVDIKEAIGRITACDIISDIDVPAFTRSSVDGYSVIASDTFGASEALPSQLSLLGEVKMGITPSLSINSGETVYIPTGGELPKNTDSVVMIEYAEDIDDGFVYIYKSVAPGNNVVYKGDDVKKGGIVINANHKLKAQDIGALAALGLEKVIVKRKIKVGIISTGDEIIEINQTPTGSQVRDINSYFIYSSITEHYGQPILYGIVPDSYEQIKSVVDKALYECDVVLISGGSSVGVRDETFNIISDLGNPGVLVHGIAVKPGKPTIIGKTYDKAVVGLPGHPASAFFILKMFILPLIDSLSGLESIPKATLSANMACNYPSNNGREEYVPVKIFNNTHNNRHEEHVPVNISNNTNNLIAEPIFSKSGLIRLLTSADGYVRIPRESEGLYKNQVVDVILF